MVTDSEGIIVAHDRLGWRAVDYLESPFITSDGFAFLTGKRDPGFYSPTIHLLAPQYTKVEITMAIEPYVPKAPVEVFWGTANTTWNAQACQKFIPVQDSEFHTYTVDFADSPLWNGIITGMRIDPPTTGKQKVTLQSVRFTPNF